MGWNGIINQRLQDVRVWAIEPEEGDAHVWREGDDPDLISLGILYRTMEFWGEPVEGALSTHAYALLKSFAGKMREAGFDVDALQKPPERSLAEVSEFYRREVGRVVFGNIEEFTFVGVQQGESKARRRAVKKMLNRLKYEWENKLEVPWLFDGEFTVEQDAAWDTRSVAEGWGNRGSKDENDDKPESVEAG